MKKKIFIFVIAVILILAIVCVVLLTQRDGSQGILYRVSGAEGTAYLLGSIHIGTSVMHPFDDTLNEAMSASDVFVFETDTSTDKSLAQLRVRQQLPEGESLRIVLGDTLFSDIEAAYQKLGLSTATLDTSMPWAVINTLAVYSSAIEMGIQNISKAISLGVDTSVRNYANSHNKQFAYLESVDEISDTMASFSDELNRYLLQDEADMILGRTAASEADTISEWPQWWHDGNIKAFQEFYQLSTQIPDITLYEEYTHALITLRNEMMAKRLDTMLRDGRTYFVTTGLLHLITEDGSIPELLREMGYTVELLVQD